MPARLWQAPALAHETTDRKFALPSWVVSCLMHGLLYVSLVVSMRHWGAGPGGLGHSRYMQVGLLANEGDGGDGLDSGQAGSLGDGRDGQALPGDGQLAQPDGVLPHGTATHEPSEAALATVVGQSLDQLEGNRAAAAMSTNGGTATALNDSSNGGAFALPPSVGSTALLDGLGGRGGRNGRGTGSGFGTNGLGSAGVGLGGGLGSGIGKAGAGGGRGGTSFFEISAKGSRFVYVVDHSGSMATYNQLPAAKAELWASLQSLDSAQQFQIIFYDDDLREFRLASSKPSLVWANEINKGIARQFLAEVQPDGGTDHLRALEAALRLRPDHIFLLTDADEPQMTAAQRQKIKQQNAGKSRIHCVEFGKGGDLGAPTFLKQLATENGGTYRYCDITKF